MPRKFGDYNFAEYYHYQSFSSDEPTKRINDTNFFLKFEKDKPAFFVQADNVFNQIPSVAFFVTAEHSTIHDFTGWKEQCEEYFNLTIEEIKCQAKQNV
jgi:hypothetical protein|tara:strand:+ start:361 stop:657 length:297 start_codon:yes stop_codon:yes gene_type:complete